MLSIKPSRSVLGHRCVDACPHVRHVRRASSATTLQQSSRSLTVPRPADVPRRQAHLPSATHHAGALAPSSHTSPLTSADGLEGSETALLWFRHDLRTDDHPGLHAAASSTTLQRCACLYVVDTALLRPLLSRPAGPEILVAALTALRSNLRQSGSDLIIRTGDSAAAVQQLVSELRGGSSSPPVTLLTEAEPPGSTWSRSLQAAVETAGSSNGDAAHPHPAKLAFWQSTAWASEPFDINYRRWQDIRGRPLPPLDSPPRLPAAPANISPGDIPSAQQLLQLLQQQQSSALAQQEDNDTSSLEARVLRRLAASAPDPQALLSSYLTSRSSSTAPAASPEALKHSFTQMLELLAPGPNPGEQSHHRFLGEAAEALVSPAVPGGSFKLLLGPWMELGALSRRRVLQCTGADDTLPPAASAGPVLPDRAAAARRSVEVSDFHQLLAEHGAASNRPADAPTSTQVMQWTWRGMRNEFCVAEPTAPPPSGAGEDAPAILLVHGFGAFGDQWRGNVSALAAAGFRVFAPTLPGFGRSEKNSVPYSQDLWRDFLRDFSAEVVGARVVVVGNSIGGFVAASLAADYPHLVAGLVLLNSAGPIQPDFTPEAWAAACAAKAPPPRFVVELVSRALFWYLERSIPGTLKWLYPTNPGRADEWLGAEIYRAACDAGSLQVFQSVFYLPPPRALNYLVSELFRGPTMVLQGVLDPLNDARSRARDMKAACPGVEVVLLEAGHCPHDEQPEKVNQELLAFIRRSVLQSTSVRELAVR